jgi:hypothetical protein
MQMSSEDIKELKVAKELLENPSLTARLTNAIGTPIEKGFNLLPANWREKVSITTRDALMVALKGTLLTIDSKRKESFPRLHKVAATLSGGVGGFFGLPALAIELPMSTMIMLRSIADIGRSHGELLETSEARIACLEVFALGGPTKKDDSSESGYYAVRTVLARAVTEATEYLAEKGLFEEGAPALVRLIAAIATRFEIQVSEKAAAMFIPAIGAFGGAAINLVFIDHFQDMGQGHFSVRKFERKYDCELVRKTYDAI